MVSRSENAESLRESDRSLKPGASSASETSSGRYTPRKSRFPKLSARSASKIFCAAAWMS
jgi:hypothetical protein